jgi:hypothetical protein
MTLSLHVQFNEPTINLLVSRDEATLGPIHLQRLCCCVRRRCDRLPTVTNYLRQQHGPSTLRETIAWNPLGFPLIVALSKGHTFKAEYYRDNMLTALTQLQPEDDGRKLVVMLTMQRLTLLQNVELFTQKMDCGSLPIHPTHLISHHPTSFCSVMSKNVSKEWRFHHTRNFWTQLVKV